jgi:hypothetical protein
MAQQARGNFVGLVTNVAETQAPPGALIDADNVVIRRAGQVEPRDGVTRSYDSGTTAAAHGFSYGSKDIVAIRNTTLFAWESTAGDTYLYDDPQLGVISPQPYRRDIFTQTTSRGNLYVPYEAGVLKLDEDDGDFLMAGLPLHSFVMIATTSAVGTWLGTNEQVAYRVISTRTDENGVIAQSVPSGAVTVSNSGAATGVLLLIGSLTSSEYDTVEIYRTRNFPTTATIDDEMQLVGSMPASNGTFWQDTVLPAARGKTLYTSPSRGGIVVQNNRPPACACTATFKGSTFFGNVRGPRAGTVSYKYSAGLTTATGVGDRTYTGDTTTGNAAVLNLSSTVGLERGQAVYGTGIPAYTWITNISGTTVTLSSAATATNVGVSLSFYDAIQISALGPYWYDVSAIKLPDLMVLLDYSGVQAYTVTPPEGGYNTTLVIEAHSRGTSALTIRATHGSEYSPPIADYDDVSPTPLEQDVWPGGLYWSKTDEPEHVAPVNYAFVGDKGKAILGLVPTRDALFVLKEDGVFRLTGTAGTWRIDPYDPTTRCVLPTSVRALNGRAYMLSARGVVRLGDDGVELVSGPVNDLVKPLTDAVIDQFNSTGYYELDGVIGSTAAVFERESEYLLLRSSTEGPLVYNENTGAWSTWSTAVAASETLGYMSLFNFPRLGVVCHGLGQHLYTTMLSTSAYLGSIVATPRFDREQAVTATVYADGALTLSTVVTALEDDAIQDADGLLWRITAAATSSATIQVERSGTPAASFALGSCVLYRTQRCRITPAGFCEPGGTQKLWTRFTSAFTRLTGAHVLRYAYESSMTPEADAESWTSEDARLVYADGMAACHSGYSYSGPVPLAHSRAWLLHASVRMALAFGDARLEALFVASRPMTEGSPQQVTP